MSNYAILTLDMDLPVVSDLSPAVGQEDVDIAAPLEFTLGDPLAGVDISSLNLTIDGVQAIIGGVIQSGYAGNIVNNGTAYTVTLTKDGGWLMGSNIAYEISVLDEVANNLVYQGDFNTIAAVDVNILPGYPDVTTLSKVANYDTVIIRWETNKAVGTYQVEVGGTGKDTGVILGIAFGSQNVQGNLPGVLEPIDTVIKGADLEAASPGSGDKRLNIYVTDAGGYYNDYEG